jgi:hypothetical protein
MSILMGQAKRIKETYGGFMCQPLRQDFTTEMNR